MKSVYVNEPKNKDYKFYLKILKMYADEYGKDAPVNSIPPIQLSQGITLGEAINEIQNKVVYDGYVVFNMRVRLAYYDENNCHIKDVYDEFWTTFGKIRDYNSENKLYSVYYSNRGLAYIKVNDIIAVDDEAVKLAEDTWNYDNWDWEEEIEA
jgi:hypothetical protein